jgi:hypothetical protein
MPSKKVLCLSFRRVCIKPCYGDMGLLGIWGIAESQGYSTIGVWYIGYLYRAADAITLYPRN